MLKTGASTAERGTPSLRRLSAAASGSSRLQLTVVAGVAAFVYLFRLGTGALLDWDEAIYAEVSREMAASGHWLTLNWQHQPFLEKPPLSFWIQAAFFHTFGVTAFWARVPSALAGVAVVVLVCTMARRLAGPAAGFYAAFALMTMNEFDRLAREGMTDTLLCLCIYLAIFAWMRLRREQPVWFYLLCAAIGAGAMIKGPAILAALPAIAADGLVARKPEKLPAGRHCVLGALLVPAMVVPWHVWMMVEYGSAFVQSYFGLQLIQRATRVIQGSGGGPFYYLEMVLRGAFPWSLVALCALARRIQKGRWDNSLLWTLAGVLLIGYSLIPTKHIWYILPIYPALAVEVGVLLAEAGARRRMIRYAATAALAAGMLVALIRLAQRRGDPFTNRVAQLASMAGRAPHAAPLLVIPDPGPDSRLDIPTAVFYSHRRATLVALPADGQASTILPGTCRSMDALIQSGALSELAREYMVHVKAQNSAAAYAEITAK